MSVPIHPSSPSAPGTTTSVVFVCKKNGGKSQLAAALLRALGDESVSVASAGTVPGGSLNAESVESLAELGIDVGDERPKPLTPAMLDGADLVVVLGDEAQLPDGVTVPVERWITDEPSERGITGMERMRLVRDDIRARVAELHARLRDA
ncbi:arsenate-mycothiol transferase ArsC [Pseudoclavibacter terrae]|uniref:Low molecular weight phosphatase family protein n=1 Tax=Pseudoclavibacter terrae TaxID=1530195 RepID=A0A7J5B299_9MICO|nr:low molecular weight phosphatase family protein [Pseudoclavibacter terrae]KAB1637154.1 low molecular weight phosphatase family protein [Pseudoclavibacter terrae]